MDNPVYKVDSRMLPPVILAMLSGVGLIVISIVKNHNFLFLIAFSPFLYLGLEILARKIVVDSTGLTIHKLFRSKRLDWVAIENVDAVGSGSKFFLILQLSKSRPIVITNTIAFFPDLVKKIIQNIPADKVSEAAVEISRSNQTKLWPIIQAWLVCAIFFSVMVGKLLE
ncbi:MAG: PH domain-containing protein [Desulfomonilaceae bacterium]